MLLDTFVLVLIIFAVMYLSFMHDIG